MFRIAEYGQSVGVGPIGFTDKYIETVSSILASRFNKSSIRTEGRKLVLRGDISSFRGTSFTTVAIEYRFVGDFVAFEVDGWIEIGFRAWTGVAMAVGIQFAEAWFPLHAGALLAFSEVLRGLCIASSAWYLLSFPYFALLTRREILAAVKDACAALEKHD